MFPLHLCCGDREGRYSEHRFHHYLRKQDGQSLHCVCLAAIRDIVMNVPSNGEATVLIASSYLLFESRLSCHPPWKCVTVIFIPKDKDLYTDQRPWTSPRIFSRQVATIESWECHSFCKSHTRIFDRKQSHLWHRIYSRRRERRELSLWVSLYVVTKLLLHQTGG
jgi:hypothetical protein